MNVTFKSPLQAKACTVAAISLALVTMAVSKAAADNLRVFNERVSGVPSAPIQSQSPTMSIPRNLLRDWSSKAAICLRIPQA